MIVNNFIEQWNNLGAKNCFANDMCWYFTLILRARFGVENKIVYDEVANYFATEIDGRIYDITGDITDNKLYKWTYWSDFIKNNPTQAEKIRKYFMEKGE